MSSVQSIRRAFAVLDALDEGPLGVTDVADRAALPKSTAARLLATLVGEGAVEQVPGETSYRLGPRLVTLAGGFSLVRSLAAVGRPGARGSRGGVRRGGWAGRPRRRPRPLHRPGRHAEPGRRARLDRRARTACTPSPPGRCCSRSARRPRSSAISRSRRSSGSPHARWRTPTPSASACATSGGAATRGRSRSSMPGSRRSRRRSRTHRARSSRRSISTGRRTDSRRRSARRSSRSWS